MKHRPLPLLGLIALAVLFASCTTTSVAVRAGGPGGPEGPGKITAAGDTATPESAPEAGPRPVKPKPKPKKTPPPPGDAYYYYVVGYDAELESKWDEAVKNYRKALALDASSASIRSQIVGVLLKAGKTDDAGREAAQNIRLNPDYVPGLLQLARIMRTQRNVDSAIPLYERAIELDPEGISPYLHLSLMFAAKKKFPEARDIIGDLLEMSPSNAKAYFYLGVIEMEAKDFAKAREHLLKAADLDPGMDNAYLNLGVASHALKENDEAERYYKQAIEINPYGMRAREQLAKLYEKQNRPMLAVEQLKAMSVHGNVDIHAKLAYLYLEQQLYSLAVPEFRQVLEERPDDTSARYYMAICLEELGRNKEALAEYKEIISQNPKHINSFLHIGYILTLMERHGEVVEVYKEILSFETGEPSIYTYLASSQIALNRYANAEETLLEGLKAHPADAELHFTAAVVYEHFGRFDIMVAHLKQAIESNPEHAEALNYLGYSYADKGINLQKSEELIRKALSLKPNSGYIVDSLAWLYFRQGRYEVALEAILKANGLIEDGDSVVLDHMGDIHDAMGETDKALEAWGRALELQTADTTDADFTLKVREKIKTRSKVTAP